MLGPEGEPPTRAIVSFRVHGERLAHGPSWWSPHSWAEADGKLQWPHGTRFTEDEATETARREVPVKLVAGQFTDVRVRLEPLGPH